MSTAQPLYRQVAARIETMIQGGTFAVGDRIELVPVVPLEQLKGFLKGLVPDFEREPDRL